MEPDTFIKHNDESYFNKLIQTLKIAIPAILSFFAERLQTIINQIFIGHFSGKKDVALVMAGVGVGDMLINITNRSIITGLNSALDTLVA